jgi:DNA processing protein
VVEAGESSGSLITAQLGLELGRDVFAVPADATRDSSAGGNSLISAGHARLVGSANDILTEWGMKNYSTTSAGMSVGAKKSSQAKSKQTTPMLEVSSGLLS